MATSSGIRQRIVRALLACALVALLPAFAGAQEPVTSFDQLNTRLKPGDTVWVTDTQGRETKGKIRELHDASLTLDREAAGRAFAAADIGRIRQRVHDSVLTGTLIGLGTGLALGALALGQGDTDPSTGSIVAAGLLFGGAGGGIGALIDYMIPGPKRDVYRAPGSGPSASLSIAPIVTARHKGVRLAFSF